MTDDRVLQRVLELLAEAAQLNVEIAKLNAQATRFERVFVRWIPALILGTFLAGVATGVLVTLPWWLR
ncbi:MAG: hypothetical protein ABWZ78_05435 [Burkholderiaceae bacterium]